MVNDRAQLLLFSAVVIGVTIVSTVVLLNGMQYAGTAGSQPETDELDRAERTEAMVERDMTRLSAYVFESEPSDPDLALEENITMYGNYSRNMTVTRGAAIVNTTYNSTRSKGKRIEYTTSPGNNHFKSDSNRNDWELVQDTRALRQFHMSVNPQDNGQDFDILVSTASGTSWELHVIESSAGTVELTVANDTTSESCSIPAASVDLDLVEGEVHDHTCPIPGIHESVEEPYTIKYEDGNHVEDSSYELLVAGDVQNVPSGSMSNYPVIPAFDFRYRSEDFSYNRTIEIENPKVTR